MVHGGARAQISPVARLGCQCSRVQSGCLPCVSSMQVSCFVTWQPPHQLCAGNNASKIRFLLDEHHQCHHRVIPDLLLNGSSAGALDLEQEVSKAVASFLGSCARESRQTSFATMDSAPFQSMSSLSSGDFRDLFPGGHVPSGHGTGGASQLPPPLYSLGNGIALRSFSKAMASLEATTKHCFAPSQAPGVMVNAKSAGTAAAGQSVTDVPLSLRVAQTVGGVSMGLLAHSASARVLEAGDSLADVPLSQRVALTAMGPQAVVNVLPDSTNTRAHKMAGGSNLMCSPSGLQLASAPAPTAVVLPTATIMPGIAAMKAAPRRINRSGAIEWECNREVRCHCSALAGLPTGSTLDSLPVAVGTQLRSMEHRTRRH